MSGLLRRWFGGYRQRPPRVSICIPAWQSQDFIARTLDFALGQTHLDIEVLVSVDLCDDSTAEIGRSRAERDPRLRVFVQRERLGWARNVNTLLDAVRGDYFFLYFHDDVIVPQYTARLLQALDARPDAISAHCSMGHFGGGDHVSAAGAYPDGVAQRLGWVLLSPQRGAPLRSLTRGSVLQQGLRMPTDAVGGLWANEPYLTRLLAAGPAVGIADTLYFRWDKRPGGLTDGWKQLSIEQVYTGYRANIESQFAALDAAALADAEREALRFCVMLKVLPAIRSLERQHGVTSQRSRAELHPGFGSMQVPHSLHLLGAEIGTLARQRHASMLAAEPGAAEGLPG